MEDICVTSLVINLGKVLTFLFPFQDYEYPTTTKKRSATFIKEKRKRYRQKKKELWKDLALDALKKRWSDRCVASEALEVAEIEEEKERERRKKERIDQFEKTKAEKARCREKEIEYVEHSYVEQKDTCKNPADTSDSPLLLDAIVTPLSEPPCDSPTFDVHAIHCQEKLDSARQERDNALLLYSKTVPRYGRGIAETKKNTKEYPRRKS